MKELEQFLADAAQSVAKMLGRITDEDAELRSYLDSLKKQGIEVDYDLTVRIHVPKGFIVPCGQWNPTEQDMKFLQSYKIAGDE